MREREINKCMHILFFRTLVKFEIIKIASVKDPAQTLELKYCFARVVAMKIFDQNDMNNIFPEFQINSPRPLS